MSHRLDLVSWNNEKLNPAKISNYVIAVQLLRLAMAIAITITFSLIIFGYLYLTVIHRAGMRICNLIDIV